MTEAQRQEWNAAVESGDAARIAALRETLLRANVIRIMDDDPNYRVAGWTVQS